jgi:hypothetical protein
MTDNLLDPSAFRAPAILLAGVVDYAMYQSFRDQLGRAPKKGLVVTELWTLGGDPEVARMMGEDVRYHSDLEQNVRCIVKRATAKCRLCGRRRGSDPVCTAC